MTVFIIVLLPIVELEVRDAVVHFNRFDWFKLALLIPYSIPLSISAEKMGHLTVEFAPTFANTVMNEAWSWDGRAANLSCRAEAIPNATISWFIEAYGRSEEVNEGPNVKRYGFQSESTLEVINSSQLMNQESVRGCLN